MLITRYTSSFDATPRVVDLTWADLVSLLTTTVDTHCHPCPGKNCPAKNGPAWSPCEVVGRRKSENVVAFHAAVFDIDHVSMGTLVALESAIRTLGFAAIVHSTHSHKPPDDCCVRVTFPVSRPVLPREWPRFRAAVIDFLKLPADPATKDLARLYFLPSWPGEGAPTPIGGALDGKPLDVDHFLAAGAPSLPRLASPPGPQAAAKGATSDDESGSFTADLGELSTFLRDAKRGADEEKRAIINAILAGEPLADEGARDNTLNRACSIVVWALPYETHEEAVLEIMRRSVRALPGEEPPEYWEQRALDMIRRSMMRRAEVRERNTAWVNAMRESLSKDSAKADEPENEDEPDYGEYTAEQLVRWAEEQRCTPEEFVRRWVIQSGTSFYVFVNGQYRTPVPNHAVGLSLLRDLSRIPGLNLWMENAEGARKAIPWNNIVNELGTVARKVEGSLVLQKSFYDAETQTFHEALAPLRRIRAKAHPEVDEWLRLLGGAEAEKLLDWVATITELDRQTCAIYLQGPPGIGKTLFANGLARLWYEGGPVPLEQALTGNFNDLLARCPLIFADEAVPKRADITSQLRRLIGSPTFALRRMYMPSVMVHGSPRLIIAGNNAHLLQTNEDLSTGDLAAVSSRFLYVDTAQAPANFLRQFSNLNSWISKDFIAEHALYLRETRRVVEGRRFLVEGTQRDFHEQLAVSSGLANNIMEFIARFLDDPRGSQMPLGHLVQAGEGQVWVSARALADESFWTKYVPSQDVQSAARIGKALSSLASNRYRVTLKGRQESFYSISANRFLTWLRHTGAVDIETVFTAVNRTNPLIRDALNSPIGSTSLTGVGQ